MKKRLKIAFLMNPLRELHYQDDTSFSLMHESQIRGHNVFFFESKDMVVYHNTPFALVAKAETSINAGVKLHQPAWMKLSTFDALVIRKEPPFNTDYLCATYFLDLIQNKVFMLNNPTSIRTFNEKMSALLFPSSIRDTFISYQPKFLQEMSQKSASVQWVLKPLFDKGGKGIKKLRATKSPLKKTLSNQFPQLNKEPIMLQKYIPHQKSGDKRILILNGIPIGAFKRLPSKKDFRANMSLGATAHPAAITQSDKKLVKKMSLFLKKHGLYLVGIDLLGRHLTEINVTSPAGIPEVNQFNQTRLQTKVVQFIEKSCRDFK